MNRAVAAFLSKHDFPLHTDVNVLTDSLLFDMNEGLAGRPSGEDMIKTYFNPSETAAASKSVIVIDAGGTNFRSCLVTFDAMGKPSIDFMEKTSMPGIDRELSKKEFFASLAQNLEHLKDKASCIGFCFSYPMTITEDGDGILIGWSKEIKAPQVVGCQIGKELKAALKENGWKNIEKITLLNDTVAALLAGAAGPNEGERYSSYIGFILGTGMNAAYIQGEDKELNIKKQIVVCESGRFDKIASSSFDKAYDAKSVTPGTSIMEKHCSGGYLGPVCWEVLNTAAKEALFSKSFCQSLLEIQSLTLIEVSAFLQSPYSTASVLGAKAAESASDEDYDKLFQLLDAVVERSARCAAAILCACVIQSGQGKHAAKPVCILCNGTTFYKTYKVKSRVEGYLDELLVNQRGLYYEIISRENDITLGAAIGGLI